MGDSDIGIDITTNGADPQPNMKNKIYSFLARLTTVAMLITSVFSFAPRLTWTPTVGGYNPVSIVAWDGRVRGT